MLSSFKIVYRKRVSPNHDHIFNDAQTEPGDFFLVFTPSATYKSTLTRLDSN